MWFRRVCFALAPLALILLVAECSLRLWGDQEDADRTVSWCREHALNQPPFFPARTAGDETSVHVPKVEAHPTPFSSEKPADVRRIFAFGGSAVHGFGFTRAGAWPAHLEGMLAGAWDEAGVEVINAGVIAWSSQQVLALVKDVVENHEPDALLIYSGNNELLEWFDARRYLPPDSLSRWLQGVRWSRRLRALRLYRWLDSWIGSGREGGKSLGHWGQTEFTDDEELPWSQRARLSPEVQDFADEAFRHHLERILEIAGRAGVPVVLSTVAVNETEAPAEFEFGDPEPVELVELLEEAKTTWDRGEQDQARDLFERARTAWPEAITHYRWGLALRELGEAQEAREHFRLAIELDENPHRTTPNRNAVLRSLSGTAGGFVDVEARLSALSEDGIIDTSLIYDYCHPTPLVHEEIARGFAEELLQIWPGSHQDAPAAEPGHVDAWLGLKVDPERGHYVRNPGGEAEQWWADAVAASEAHPQSVEAWMHRGVVAWHGFHADCFRGKLPCLGDAIGAFHKATQLDPSRCDAWANLGRVQFAMGMDEAYASLSKGYDCDRLDERTAWYLWRMKRRALP